MGLNFFISLVTFEGLPSIEKEKLGFGGGKCCSSASLTEHSQMMELGHGGILLEEEELCVSHPFQAS